MPDTPTRTDPRPAAGGRTGRRLALTGCVLTGGVLAGLATCRYGGALAPELPFHPPTPAPIIALGVVGLVCYTMFFLLCEATLLVLAVINIQDEKVHNKYRSLMLLVLYVFTFRYRQVLPAKFFAEAGGDAKGGSAAGRPYKAGKHRRGKRAATSGPDSPPPASSAPPSSPSPVSDEEMRAAFALLIARMATVLGGAESGSEGRPAPRS
jgi:hypothetical protein